MGILRADRITGLGGANAITGSVSFPHDGEVSAGESGALQVHNENDALTFGTGDFTVEFWFYANRVGVVQNLYDGRGTGSGSNTAVLIRLSDSNNIQFFTTNAFRITGSTTIIKNAWYHVALTRTSGTHTLYVNGSSDGTWSQSSLTYTGPTNNFAVIGSDDNRDGRYGLNGYISNLRVAKELIYSAAFSVPTTALAPTSNTTLLCCQSPGNVNASFGDPILTAFASNTNSKGPEASRFTPNSPVGFSTTTDVGSQYGTTFDGFGNFVTSTYMVPPGGNARERNRGRALFGGGEAPTRNETIDFIEIQSGGIGQDFGDLTSGSNSTDAVSSKTRAVFTVWNGPASYKNVLEYVTIATTGNAADFGDQTVETEQEGTASNDIYGVFAGGYNLAYFNQIERITLATLGNATDFGDLITSIVGVGGAADTTRGIFAGGIVPGATQNVIQYITIASAGNATDFGDLTSARRNPAGTSDSTRGIFSGGSTPTYVNTIDFITIQTTGNATDFGDLVTAGDNATSASNNTRGIIGGHYLSGSPHLSNIIESVIIQTAGNAVDYGDLFLARAQLGACSDSHGGLS